MESGPQPRPHGRRKTRPQHGPHTAHRGGVATRPSATPPDPPLVLPRAEPGLQPHYHLPQPQSWLAGDARHNNLLFPGREFHGGGQRLTQLLPQRRVPRVENGHQALRNQIAQACPGQQLMYMSLGLAHCTPIYLQQRQMRLWQQMQRSYQHGAQDHSISGFHCLQPLPATLPNCQQPPPAAVNPCQQSTILQDCQQPQSAAARHCQQSTTFQHCQQPPPTTHDQNDPSQTTISQETSPEHPGRGGPKTSPEHPGRGSPKTSHDSDDPQGSFQQPPPPTGARDDRPGESFQPENLFQKSVLWKEALESREDAEEEYKCVSAYMLSGSILPHPGNPSWKTASHGTTESSSGNPPLTENKSFLTKYSNHVRIRCFTCDTYTLEGELSSHLFFGKLNCYYCDEQIASCDQLKHTKIYSGVCKGRRKGFHAFIRWDEMAVSYLRLRITKYLAENISREAANGRRVSKTNSVLCFYEYISKLGVLGDLLPWRYAIAPCKVWVHRKILRHATRGRRSERGDTVTTVAKRVGPSGSVQSGCNGLEVPAKAGVIGETGVYDDNCASSDPRSSQMGTTQLLDGSLDPAGSQAEAKPPPRSREPRRTSTREAPDEVLPKGCADLDLVSYKLEVSPEFFTEYCDGSGGGHHHHHHYSPWLKTDPEAAAGEAVRSADQPTDIPQRACVESGVIPEYTVQQDTSGCLTVAQTLKPRSPQLNTKPNFSPIGELSSSPLKKRPMATRGVDQGGDKTVNNRIQDVKDEERYLLVRYPHEKCPGECPQCAVPFSLPEISFNCSTRRMTLLCHQCGLTIYILPSHSEELEPRLDKGALGNT